MDWSKSKSIFIVVFLILNVFLYSLYLNRHTEAQQFEVLSERKIESQLNDDNITINNLPTKIEAVSYISAKVKDFSKEELKIPNSEIVESDYKLTVMLKEPVKIRETRNKASFDEFLQTNVYEGSSYVLWEIDEKSRSATFFQRANDKTIYYNINGILSVYWNDKNEIIKYEQTMLEKVEKLEEKKQLLQPIKIIQVLYSRGDLESNSEVVDMKLGYSTLVQLTEIQVFVPTWVVHVKSEDGKVEEYFVNATDGKLIDMQLEFIDVEEEMELENMNEIKMEVSKE